MEESVNIACQPVTQEYYEGRHSNDFCIIQLPHPGKLIWHIITISEEGKDIIFDVKEHHTYKEDSIRFQNIQDGTITEYMPYRNLYIADVRNASSYFIVRIEVCS